MVEKKRAFIINFVYALIIIVCTYLVLRFSVNYLMPFIIGFIIAFVLKPVIAVLTRLFGKRKWTSLVVIIVFYMLLGTLLIWLFFALLSTVKTFVDVVPDLYVDTMKPAIEEITIWFTKSVKQIDSGIAEFLTQFLSTAVSAIEGFLRSFSAATLSFLTGFISSVPSILIAILISIISSFFFTLDYEKIVNTMMMVIPEKQRSLVNDAKTTLIRVIGRYLRAYGLLMSLTFVQLSIAFLFLGISNPIGLAIMIASVDILPVLGTGSVMIPWSLWQIAVGDRTLGIALVVVYIIITINRNILEPKIVGDQIGLHPLVTLMCIYLGVKLFGFVGLLGLPIVVTLVKSLHDEGKIQIFNDYYKHNNPDVNEPN